MTFNPTHEETVKWDSLITRVSKGVVKDFPDLEWDDLYSSLWEDVIKDDSYNTHVYAPWMRTHLRKRCRVVAWNLRKENLQWSSQYVYRPSDIRIILRAVFDYDDWERTFLPGDATEENNAAARLDLAVDLSWSLDQLSVSYRSILESHYHHGIEYEDGSAERKMLYRAEVRLTELLNQYRGQWQRQSPRRAITNAHANYVLEEQVDG